MKNHNYNEKILEIIDTNGGCFTGFLRLQEIGNFHSTTLQNHLLEMEKHNKIIINKPKVGRKRTKYCRIKPSYKFRLKLEDRYIQKIRKLKEKALTHEKSLLFRSNIVKIAFNKYKNIFLGELSSKLLNDYPVDSRELNIAKRHYWSIIWDELEDLKESDIRRIINSLYEDSPERLLWKNIKNLSRKNLHSSA